METKEFKEQIGKGFKNAEEAGKIGGVQSGIAKRRKKSMKEMLNILLHMDATPEQINAMKNQFPNLSDDDFEIATLLLYAQISNAVKGDTRAFEAIRDTSGQRPVDEYRDMTQDVTVEVDGEPDEAKD